MLNLHTNTDKVVDEARPILSRLFGKMTDEVFEEISQMLTWNHFESDDCIFRESEAGDSMYIVVQGRLRVVREYEGQEKTIAEIRKGECVGEMSLLTGKPRTASIFAVRDCDLLRLTRSSFEKIVRFSPEVGLNLSRLLIKRFSEKRSLRPIKGITNITLIPLHSSINVHDAKANLEGALSQDKKFRVVDAESVNSALGESIAQIPSGDNLQNSKLTRYLNDIEEENDFVFYLPDSTKTEWTKRCVRQADEIILIADFDASPELTQIERELFYNHKKKFSSAKQTLLLVHPEYADLPSGTKKWLTPRPQINFHQHLRRSNMDDYGRLGRYLSDESIGLVLAGGGIKGMAHIGVIRAMEEFNIPIDFIGGTSMGAVIGGGAAFGWGADKLHEIALELAAKRPMRDYNFLPFISFLKGGQVEEYLGKYYEGRDIEDCNRNFYCISANLSNSKQVIHRSGSLFGSIRSSFSLPGILPPKIGKEGLLIDGGVMNNFPVDVMIETGAKTIIGVEFSGNMEKKPEFESYPSGLQMLTSKFKKKKSYKDVPTLMNTLVKSSLLNSFNKAQEAIEMTDIHIKPDTRKVGLLDWKATETAIESGYNEAVKVFSKKWKG